MPETIDTLINALLIRLRDPQGFLVGESQVNVRSLMSELLWRTQQIYNEGLSLKLLQVSSPQFHALAQTLWYPLAQVQGPSGEQMTALSHVTHQGRDLTKATLDDLKSIDTKWSRAIGPRLECFIPLGFTHFILWPMLNQEDTQVTLYGPLLTPPITAPNTDTLVLSDNRIILLLQLVELMMSNRANDELAFTTLIKNFTQFLPEDIVNENRRETNAPPKIAY